MNVNSVCMCTILDLSVMSKFLNYYCFMAPVLCYTAGKFDYYLWFCVKFLNCCFGSLFWLPRVPIGSLFLSSEVPKSFKISGSTSHLQPRGGRVFLFPSLACFFALQINLCRMMSIEAAWHADWCWLMLLDAGSINQSIYSVNVLIGIDTVMLMLILLHSQDSHRQACFRDCPF